MFLIAVSIPPLPLLTPRTLLFDFRFSTVYIAEANQLTYFISNEQGISLPIEQFNALIKVIPDIEAALAEKGQSIQRPDYSGAGASAALDEEEEEEDEEVEKEGKKNFEETSDDE